MHVQHCTASGGSYFWAEGLTNEVVVALEVLCQCVDNQNDQIALVVQE